MYQAHVLSLKLFSHFSSLADCTINITTIRVVYLWLVGMPVTSKKTNIMCNGKLMMGDIDSIASSFSEATFYCYRSLVRRPNGRLNVVVQ